MSSVLDRPGLEKSPLADLHLLASGPSAGLALLDGVELPNYQPLWAARAELLRRAGDLGAAGEAYARAIELSGNAAERAALERRRNGAG